jgi:phosphoserine phosphatase
MGRDGGPEDNVSVHMLEQVLEVTKQLARPFVLTDLLTQVVDAGRALLDADRGTVFLYAPETHELVAAVATGMDELRFPADKGIVGEAARTREIVNVPDAYADPRFNPESDKSSGYRTRCLLTVPLIGFDDNLVGVLQLLNKKDGVFGEQDERIAKALGAQCAVALQRAQITDQLVAKERIDRELAVAREIQMNFIPRKLPKPPGYDIGGLTNPAEETGGDTFDLIPLPDGKLLLLLGDATGHGVGPALSVTQVRAMARLAVRLGADLDSIFHNINDQLAQDLPSGRFVTGFLGILDPEKHRIDYHSGGQGPLLYFTAADGVCDWRPATTIPMGMMESFRMSEQSDMVMDPGNIAGVISDGVFETENELGEQLGTERVGQLIRDNQEMPMAELAQLVFDEATAFGAHAPQADDITILLVRRVPE